MGLEMAKPFFLQVAPGLVAQAFAFPQRGIGKALRATDDDAIDVSLQATIGHREAELLAIGLSGAQVKTCVPQPRDHAVLHYMATLEDAQHPARGVPPVVAGGLGVLELQRALTNHPEARGPEVLALGLAGASLLQARVHQGGDLTRDAR